LSLLAKELPKIFQRAANGDSLERPAKKRKVAAEEEPTMLQTRQCRQPDLPPGIDLLEPIINAYFTQVHHWIPMVHQGRFRRRLKIPGERDHLELLIHAMALSTARYIHSEQAHSSCDASSGRDWIVSSAISRPSVESMQALIIVAFNDVSSYVTVTVIGNDKTNNHSIVDWLWQRRKGMVNRWVTYQNHRVYAAHYRTG
jgi:hypothetical protein